MLCTFTGNKTMFWARTIVGDNIGVCNIDATFQWCIINTCFCNTRLLYIEIVYFNACLRNTEQLNINTMPLIGASWFHMWAIIEAVGYKWLYLNMMFQAPHVRPGGGGWIQKALLLRVYDVHAQDHMWKTHVRQIRIYFRQLFEDTNSLRVVLYYI